MKVYDLHTWFMASEDVWQDEGIQRQKNDLKQCIFKTVSLIIDQVHSMFRVNKLFFKETESLFQSIF